MRKILLILLCCLTMGANAQRTDFWRSLHIYSKVGFNLGGTAPIGLPPTIRQLNHYSIQANPIYGIDAEKPMDEHWGIMLGLHYENKGMKEDARVKNYRIAIVRGGQQLEGQYTGDVTTEVDEWMLTVPAVATYHIGKRLRLHLGPYLSILHQRRFEGYAHNGYLRVGDPTGAKIDIGDDPTTKGTYDFSSAMRRLQWGITTGVNYRCFNKLGIFAELKWGLSGVHKRSFTTIEQTLYPIFGTMGVSYQFR